MYDHLSDLGNKTEETRLDNNKKLELIVRFERNRKRKQWLMLIGVLVIFGLLMVYFQVMNFEKIN